MSASEKTVFLSYRRTPSMYVARSIFEALRERGYDVFMDVESINSGQWARIILNQIAARAHFLIILAPGTLERCQEPNDMLRREIEQAINLKRNIVPVFMPDFDLGDINAFLTGRLTELSSYNGPNLHHEYFEAAMDRLCDSFFQQPVYGEIQPTPLAEEPIVAQKIKEAEAEAAKEIARQAIAASNQLLAEEHFERASTRNPRDYAGKIADYTQAINLNSQHELAYYNRGVAHANMGNDEAAIADYAQAIRLNPQYALAYNSRGRIHERRNAPAAIADYTQAIRLYPQYADAYNSRGRVYSTRKDYPAAIADFTQAIRIVPQYADAYNNRGNVYAELGDYGKALADYTHAINHDPQYVMAYNNRGVAYSKLQNYQAALADFNEALRIDPQNKLARENREIVLRKMK